MKRYKSALIRLLVVACSLSQVCNGYSVLTHEEIVDLLWDDQLKPLLLQKYPGTSPEDLRVAHSYAYGGCLIQDIGYYPFGNKLFSDLVHYVRSGDFVQALLKEASDVNEYAFALGALAHYASDITGHPAVNTSVAEVFPKLRAKYGPAVTYGEDPKSHIRTEFGFDVVQVAKKRFASDAYHDFIGFRLAKPVLERAFLKTYGVELKEIFSNFDFATGTFRRSVSSIIPEMTRVALVMKKDEMVKEDPSFAQSKFLYNLSRVDYEREWGNEYQKPGVGTRILAFLFRIIPKIGPFKAVGFKMPTAETETLYLKSVNSTVDQYRAYLLALRQNKLLLENKDFDTGKLTRAGEYRLTDEAYAKLLEKLAAHGFTNVSAALQQNILAFYQNPDGPNAMKDKPDEWNKALSNLEQLKTAAPQAAAAVR